MSYFHNTRVLFQIYECIWLHQPKNPNSDSRTKIVRPGFTDVFSTEPSRPIGVNLVGSSRCQSASYHKRPIEVGCQVVAKLM